MDDMYQISAETAIFSEPPEFQYMPPDEVIKEMILKACFLKSKSVADLKSRLAL